MTRHDLTTELIGGPTLLIEVGGLRIITDPTFDAPRSYPEPFESDVPQPPRPLRKTTAPARSAEDIGRVDLALISHDHHEDNLDRAGREFLATVGQVLTTGLGAERLGNGAIGLDDYATHTVDLPAGGSVTVTGVPAHHGPEGVWQAVGPVTGFVLSGDLPSTYISGDNASLDVVDEIAARFPDVEIAIVFAGDPGWPELADGACVTMSGETCVAVSDRWPDAVVVPVHCDSWDHFREGVDEVRSAFEAAGKADRLHVLSAGTSEVTTA
ncbi:MBL fold metallo-hydrolase [Gordonia McavH-238-E]|uniref:MBL fold metallo-hydrolase n=1 Tax=Gordonia sp. McavH-238-E TaxID=2917736 RepID=UPI001EF4AA4E|nr:MBL fold metallo-hydrolase [Gordonia sp. McavH-238-E]MCG7632930.1 MBL fold metallo-hydrolase [Gordonia sp. McavH-238-E]